MTMTMTKHHEEMQVLEENARFRLNVDAPEFVPTLLNATMPLHGCLYRSLNNVSGDGGDWRQETSAPLIINNATSVPSNNNQQSKKVLTEEIQKKILKQMEYQFSDMSLLANDALAKQISKDPEGYVPISAVACTKKIKSLVGTDYQLLAQGLLASSKLDVSSDGKKVKRKLPFSEKVKEDLLLRTIVAENLPDDHSHQNIEKIFNVAGRVKTIRICHPQDPSTRSKGDMVISTKLHALVEFESPESAEKAAEKLNDQRDWRKGLRVRCLLRQAASPKSVLKSRKSSDLDGTLDDDAFLAEITKPPSQSPPQTTFFDMIAAANNRKLAQTEENSAGSKKVWGKGRGKTRMQRPQIATLGRGLLASSPLLSASNSIFGEASTRQTIKGPRMPDGTRGFTMGRGRPMVVAPSVPRFCPLV